MVDTINKTLMRFDSRTDVGSFDSELRVERAVDGAMWGSDSMTGALPLAGGADRFVSYASVADRLHRFRLWSAGVIAVGLGLIGVLHGLPGVWISSAIALCVAAHAAYRLRWPGTSPDDAVHLDNLAVLAYLAMLRPPLFVVGVAVLYMLLFTGLFLIPRMATVAAAYVIVGVSAITWALPAQPMDRAMAAELAVVLLLAGVPPVAWLFGRLAEALGGRRQMVGRLYETTTNLQRLFDKSVVPMYRSTPHGAIVDGNEALLSLFAAPDLESFRAQPLIERYVNPERRDELLRRLDADGAIRAFEARLRRLDGTQFDGRMSASLIETTSGLVIEGIIEDVTVERQAGREALITSAVFDQLGSAVVVADDQRRVTKWNRQAEVIFGLETSEAFGRLTIDVLKGTEPGMAERVREELETEGHWEGEADVIGADGAPIPMAVSATVVTDADDGVVAFAMVFTDLSDIHRARRQVRFQADLLAQVYNAVVATDLDGLVTYWNPAAERLYGWTAEEAVGKRIDELTVPEREAARATSIMASIVKSGGWQGEFELRRKDGSSFPALVANRVIRDEDGRPSGIVGVSMDLTARHAAERQARRSEELARSVLDAVHFPVAVVADDGEILDVNDAWTTFTLENDGDPSETGIGVNYLEACTAATGIDPGLGKVVAGIAGVLSGQTDSFSFEYPCHSNEAERWFMMEVSPIEGIGAVIAHIDMTSEVQARQSLQDIISDKDRFLATVSHELRTPLTAVVGFAEHLRSGHATPEDLPDHIDVLADQAREVADLVEDLLLAGRLDTDTIVIRPEPISAETVITAITRPWTDTTFDIAIDDDAQTVLADPLRTRQIMRNLVTNAIRHGEPPITIRVHREATTVLIDVIDVGPGVPPASADQLYQPYADLTVMHGQPGSVGLGLYVSQRLAQLMGGTISYRRAGGTTVFTLTLPAA